MLHDSNMDKVRQYKERLPRSTQLSIHEDKGHDGCHDHMVTSAADPSYPKLSIFEREGVTSDHH